MLDAMGYYRLYHPMRTFRGLIRADDCIRKTNTSVRPIAQGLANYAKLDPTAVDTGIPGVSAPHLMPGLYAYLEFLCPDIFTKAAYERDDAIAERYPIDPKDRN